ncbi:DNA-packaging protein FI [Citrobacter freundii]|uniref:DNA-packaging protein FI n=1 Tax=Citrobacter freundii TaxID=546 RepID=A0ABY7KT30_CITFR|nr:DNA-packaging protein FI [Citrobacter freundii]EIJ9082404.1 DNA-packaging protein FI [Citrobacter freundii]EJH9545376.1 DNA-packaging protein FI [Citrobacter freundii]EJO6481246.1 DNA-packaging protein FI [Citrobacter freundii]EKW5683904.1 DNA-packaging protein FI [Citrobacter freundii]EKX5705416.1 DNA-packaging protein FI [Citrobacter freundii]
MATKEENLQRLRELAGRLEREPDVSGSAADIAQRVAEWEEEIAASGEVATTKDKQVIEQPPSGGQVIQNNGTLPDEMVTVRTLTCLHVNGYAAGNGMPIELPSPGMRIRVSPSVAETLVGQGMAEYA